jgi:hypothetical protein
MNGAPQSNMLVQLIPFVVIFAIFYLLIIMPARKKQKQHQKMINSVKGYTAPSPGCSMTGLKSRWTAIPSCRSPNPPFPRFWKWAATKTSNLN